VPCPRLRGHVSGRQRIRYMAKQVWPCTPPVPLLRAAEPRCPGSGGLVLHLFKAALLVFHKELVVDVKVGSRDKPNL